MAVAAIVSKPQKPELEAILRELAEWLTGNGYSLACDRESAEYLGRPELGHERSALAKQRPELVVALGGDGTLLSAARAFALEETPILGVNLGSLGFLTEIPLGEMYRALEAWKAGSALVDTRSLLHARLVREGQVYREWDALNDVVVSKGAIARMGEFAVELDGQFVARFRADGVIVSTPTGSTAYTLAADGPILMPTVDAMVMTAICPHLLTIRPIVFPAESEMCVSVDGVPHEIYLTVDGQEAIELLLADRVVCSKSRRKVHLLRLEPNGLFNVLRSKLKWGER